MNRLFAIDGIQQAEDIRSRLADPKKHWKKGFSAYELANSWISAQGFPDAVRSVLDDHPSFRDAELIEAFFERKVELETPGRPSQCDVLVYAKIQSSFAVIAVEGKVKEPFGEYVYQKDDIPGVKSRISNLCDRLQIPLSLTPQLRYQLMHRTVSAILEAERYHAEHALMLVHSFCPNNTSFNDYRAFALTIGFPESSIAVNRITGSKTLRGLNLYLGWVNDVNSNESHTGVDKGGQNFPYEDGSFKSIFEGGSGQYTELIASLKSLKRSTPPVSTPSRTISSNVSSGFKAKTGGQDYKKFFNDVLRLMVANLGSIHGIPTLYLIELAVQLKDEPAAVKRRILSNIFDD